MFFSKKNRISRLMFEATPQCTLKCLHCYNVQKRDSDYGCTLQDTQETIDLLDLAIKQSQCRHITLTGGEIYTRPDLHDIMDGIEKSGRGKIQINLMTNGTLLDDEKIEFARNKKVRFYEMQFISANKDVFDAVAQSFESSAFNQAVLATQKIIKHNIPLIHIFVATRKNIETLQDTLTLSYALGVRHFSFNRYNPACRGNDDLIADLQLEPLKLAEGLKICDDFAKKHLDMKICCPIIIPPCLVDINQFRNLSFTFCAIKKNPDILVLDYAGNVRLCTFSPTIIGNIKTQSLGDILTSEQAQKFVAARPDFCVPCRWVKRCQGGCKASADCCLGDVTAENPFLATYKNCSVRE